MNLGSFCISAMHLFRHLFQKNNVNLILININVNIWRPLWVYLHPLNNGYVSFWSPKERPHSAWQISKWAGFFFLSVTSADQSSYQLGTPANATTPTWTLRHASSCISSGFPRLPLICLAHALAPPSQYQRQSTPLLPGTVELIRACHILFAMFIRVMRNALYVKSA